jgi:peptidoglycan hydrolase-like protein with peptidoglycan-binding domain
MTSVRLSPRLGTPVQGHHAARPLSTTSGAVKKSVDGFERKSVVTQVLQRGMTGAAVTSLQQKLVAAKFMSNADFRSGPGVYGPRTEAAVMRLQQSVGLAVTGLAGPTTMAALASGARYQPAVPKVQSPETTTPIALAHVRARLSETFTDEVTQPIGIPI